MRRPVRARRDPAEPLKSRPANDAHEDGLGLVGQGVAGGDLRRPDPSGRLPQELVAELAGRFFEVEPAALRVEADVAGARDAGDAPLPGGGFRERLVLARAGPELVVEVGDDDADGHFPPQFEEQFEQGHRILAPRKGRQDLVARLDEPRPDDGFPESLVDHRGTHCSRQIPGQRKELIDSRTVCRPDFARIWGTPGGVAQLVRACGSYPQSRGFKSLRRHSFSAQR